MTRRSSASRPELDWDALRDRAEAVVVQIVESLPEMLKAEAVKVTCLYHHWSDEVRDDHALGQYNDFVPNQMSKDGGVMVLFLGDLAEYCARRGKSFEAEVKKTYLHELGHHFGWDEDDLRARGL
ncbi:MAG TPA: metallopeptidase family protein [Chthoniobacteraceae bacterium]|nr:metallopeptidase family protein [Chthoniobacteraceae bacterium]